MFHPYRPRCAPARLSRIFFSQIGAISLLLVGRQRPGR
jgi:hypothetical protein